MTPAEELARYLGARPHDGSGGPVTDAKSLTPMLCEREEAAERVLDRPGWLFELKLDGVRIIADKRGDRVRLLYRKLRDATDSYAEVTKAIASLPEDRVVLDGEIVAFDEHGRPDFQRLGHRIHADTSRSARSPVFVPVVYVVFDVLAVGPYDVRSFPLEARKEILSRVIPEEGASGGVVRLHPTFGDGVELFRLCREHRLEGVVAKKLGSSYRSAERSADWLKIKCELDAEFVVIGWTEGESDRARLGALDLGAYEGDRLVFRGRVGSGLDNATIDALLERLLPMEVPHPVAEGKYSPKPRRHHCRPELVVSVRYGGWSLDPSGARFLRFPVFRGLRPDVSPRDCTAGPDDAPTASPKARRPAASAAPAGAPRPSAPRRRIHVTAPAQALLADGTTKDALCKYFEAVAPAVLRHARGRVMTLRRPDGSVLWPPPKWTPKFVQTTSLKTAGRDVRGFVVDSIDALLFAVEAGAPFLHHGPILVDRRDQADFVALRVTASAADARARAALAVRAIADEVGLPAVAKVAGADAIDVIVGLGAAPAAFATPLGELLRRLAVADDAVADDVAVAVVDDGPVAFGPAASSGNRATVAAVVLGWDELDRVDGVDLAAIGLEAAVARVAAADLEAEDALMALAAARVDVAAAATAIERALAVRALR